MSHLVITIGCEYGAKGNQIGRKIAEDLGFQFYDRNIVDAIIHEVGIPGEIMEKVEKALNRQLKPWEKMRNSRILLWKRCRRRGTRRVFTIRRSYKTCDSCTENDYPQVVGQRILCDYRSFRRLYSKRT